MNVKSQDGKKLLYHRSVILELVLQVLIVRCAQTDSDIVCVFRPNPESTRGVFLSINPQVVVFTKVDLDGVRTHGTEDPLMIKDYEGLRNVSFRTEDGIV